MTQKQKFLSGCWKLFPCSENSLTEYTELAGVAKSSSLPVWWATDIAQRTVSTIDMD